MRSGITSNTKRNEPTSAIITTMTNLRILNHRALQRARSEHSEHVIVRAHWLVQRLQVIGAQCELCELQVQLDTHVCGCLVFGQCRGGPQRQESVEESTAS